MTDPQRERRVGETGSTERRLRILHLAFEDPRRPGSGGGSLRNHMVNSRLARAHDVTAVVSRYRGARAREEDGVRYRHIGLPIGHFPSMIAYHFAAPWYVLRHRADVVVEDFAAPHSSDFIPLITRRPTVAIVQYLFAREKSLLYRLPFWRVEVAGVQAHEHMISVSGHIAERLRELNGRARIDVVYAGVMPTPGVRDDPVGPPRLLFLGRFEWEMKGLDFLVTTIERVLADHPEAVLRIAGSGPHEERLRRAIRERGLGPHVEWLGRVEGDTKWAALRDATVVLMPSRFETFGLVALEAMSVGTPVVAFDIPTLREIVGQSDGAVLVSLGDVDLFAKATTVLLGDADRRAEISRAASLRANDFDWDAAAVRHEQIYLDAVATDRRPRSVDLLRRAAHALAALISPRFADGRRIPSPRRSMS